MGYSRDKLSVEKQQAIIDLYRAGVSVRQICRKVGVAYETVRRYRHKTEAEADTRMSREDREKQIAALVDEGLTRKQIAKRLGISYTMVKAHCPKGKDPNLKPKKRKALLRMKAYCRVCGAMIVCEVENKSMMYDSCVAWGRQYATCKACGQTFQMDALIDKRQLEMAWWDAMDRDNSSVDDPREPPRAYVGRLR